MGRPHLTLTELLARRLALNERIAAAEVVEREQALETIRALMKEHGLTLQQVERNNAQAKRQ